MSSKRIEPLVQSLPSRCCKRCDRRSEASGRRASEAPRASTSRGPAVSSETRAEQALQVENSAERAAQLLARMQVGVQLARRRRSGVRSPPDPAADAGWMARSRRLPIGVWQQSRVWKRVVRAEASQKSGSIELKVANGDLIELEMLGALVEADAVDVRASTCCVLRT